MATYTWVGGADIDGPNNWITPANWTVGGLPTAAFPNTAADVAIVNIDDGSRDAIISGGQSITVGLLNIGGTTSGAVQGGHVIVGGGPEIGGGGGGTLTSTTGFGLTSTNSGGALVGGPNSLITGPGLGLAGPGVIAGGGGLFSFSQIVNNGTLQADGGEFGLGPLILNAGTISGTGVIEVDNTSLVEINAPTNNGIQVLTQPGNKATIWFDQPTTFTGFLNLVTPDTSVDLYFKNQNPTSVTFDPAGFLNINGAGGVLDRIPFVSNGTVALTVIPAAVAGYGAVHLGPSLAPGIPAPVNGISATTLSAADLSAILAGDQSAARFVSGTEAITTVDGTLSVGPDTNEAFLTRLYEGLLGRAPDQRGLSGWDAALPSAGKAAIAQAFVASPEFQGLLPSQSDVDFVNVLYRGLLGREADGPGQAAWVNALAGGTSRGQIAALFADSDEAKVHWSGATSAGRFAFNPNSAIVREDYRAAFAREADTPGLAGWTNALNAGLTPAQLAQNFTGSAEFQGIYGPLNNTQYVDGLYVNTLGRQADPAGEAAWVAALNGGATRASVLAAFAQSPESQARLTWALT